MVDATKTVETRFRESLSELKEYKDENAQLKADLRKCKDVLVELGIELKKLSTDDKKAKIKVKKSGIFAKTTKEIQIDNFKVMKIPKHEQEFSLIERGITNNNLLGHLNMKQIRAIGDYMTIQDFSQGATVCREGEKGDFLYVISSGCVSVTKGSEHYGIMETPQSFGELAILYNCPRTATVTATTPVTLWAIERRVYMKIMEETYTDMLKRTQFITQAPVFKNLNKNEISKLASVLEEEFFKENEEIVRQGAVGNTFYLIKEGHVKVSELDASNMENTLRTLKQGNYFGEIALLQPNAVRTATVTAITNVHLFSLDKEYFQKLIGVLPSYITSPIYSMSSSGLLSPMGNTTPATAT